MGKEKSTMEMAEELGLNVDNVKRGLKKEKKNVSEAISAAYKFKQGKGSKK